MQGTDFGRYRLLELLGRGGMGEVWRAKDTATDRIVAVKVLLPHWASDTVFQERFRREAHAAAGLNEPHVVPIHDYGEIDGRLFVDMRLIEGSDLQTILRAGPLSPARAVYIVEQIAMAVEAAHEVGLVHRDIKPSNILVAKFDFAYLIDFGIAHATGDGRLTNTGSTLGTWHYMAPERFTTGQADTSADIYALTCVLHECLTGTRPFPGDSAEQQITAHLMTPPPRPSLVTRGVPTSVDGVVARGMAKDPYDRYRTPMDLARAARAALNAPQAPAATLPAPLPAIETSSASTYYGAPPTLPAPPPQKSARNSKVLIGAAAFVAVAVLAVAAIALVVSNSSSDTAATPTASPDTSTSRSTTMRTWPPAPTTSKVAPREDDPPGPQPTIASYISENNIQETPIKPGDPGAPTIDLPVPQGWERAGAETPEWAYGAITYTGPEAAEYSPSIIALLSKLTGDVDPQTILDLAPGELQNMPGWVPANEGRNSTLDNYRAYQRSGTWQSDGRTKVVAQKTVVIPRPDGLYVLQLNADGLESQSDIVGAATVVIDEQTKIRF
ncbi:LpqN/LpqT family lipoprotein [Mycolicibacterium gadium]|uniref:non-specific serine/threonine protein kinase n=1 Tax=Mycolicibacterium gadium TaxID=1794 RepID=A0ABT6GVF0_MYCGU|nr:LpqN/LpqT family lipoprotein [Mycolicibacterium gadium]MDG5485753.1 LpqN/LpqT family lipoprotein [Mycolicibacterium gadium]